MSHYHLLDASDARTRAKQILARHLCGWITGHAAPQDHFLIDAEMIFEEMDADGIRFSLED